MKESKRKAKMPLPLYIILYFDVTILLFAMATFCYFHHIRNLYGIGADEKNAMEVVSLEDVPGTAVETTVPSVEQEVDMGDFGASFPHVFLGNNLSPDENVTFLADGEIRDYLTQNGLNVTTDEDSTYIGLYRSGDIFLTAEEIHTILHFNDKDYTVTYYQYDVYVRNMENLFTAAVTERKPIEELSSVSYLLQNAEEGSYITYPSILSVNGDYWGNANQALFTVRNHKILRDSDYIAADICVLYDDGTMETITAEEFDRDALMAKNPYQVWEFGPALLDDEGHALTLADFNTQYYDNNVIDSRHPRAAIGYHEPGHYTFLVIDGRSEQSQGVRVAQIGLLYEELGCKVAYNLDGGDSALSYFNGSYHRIDEERSKNGEGQRSLYDIISIGEVVQP